MPSIETPPFGLTQRLAGTDRGDLWMADFGNGRRSLIRLLDRRLANAAFKSALNDLSSAIARNHAPRLLRIQSHGFSGDHYYVEYLNGAPVHSVPEYFSRAHWLN